MRLRLSLTFCISVVLVSPIFLSGVERASAQTDEEMDAEMIRQRKAERAANLIKARQPEMTFKFRPFAGPSGGDIEAHGRITERSLAKLEATIEAGEAESKQVNYISLNSDGGSLGIAIRIGQLLRRKQIATSTGIETICLSACAIAFLGGPIRSVDNSWGAISEAKIEPQDVLGFHAFNLARNGSAQLSAAELREVTENVSMETQTTLGDLASYMTAMGVNPEIIRLSSSFGRGQFLFPPISELERLGIVSTEGDGGDFRLVPDGNNATAIYSQDQSQLLLTCEAIGVGQSRPIMIMSARVWKSNADYALKWEGITKASTILGAKGLPWAPRDIEHRHFHAHDQLPYWRINPVFGRFDIGSRGYGESEDKPEPKNNIHSKEFRFVSTSGAFHLIYIMKSADVNYFKSESHLSVFVTEGGIGAPEWSIHADNTDQDRENIAFALKGCAP
jgi:hypothetical protein